ncbi:hypothetical protein [Escherichia phage BI-EHEC]|nr:hypothetical protein [Escherichia phage BI-EHEC]
MSCCQVKITFPFLCSIGKVVNVMCKVVITDFFSHFILLIRKGPKPLEWFICLSGLRPF